MAKRNDIVEIFGYSPIDISVEAKAYWTSKKCPFVNAPCIKYNHDQTVVYGVCSVTSAYGDIIVCPNRLYANSYEVIRRVARDAFPSNLRFINFNDYSCNDVSLRDCIVAIGKGSGKEIRVDSISMDWILVRIKNKQILEYVGIEVQSGDITGNYREVRQAYEDYTTGKDRSSLPRSRHGINWANIHKRLMSQLIRKGVVYSSSEFATKGLYFILPEPVFQKFTQIIGPLKPMDAAGPNTISIHTYNLADPDESPIRDLVLSRTIRFDREEFALGFIAGYGLPSGSDLDSAISSRLGLSLKT